MATGHIDQLHKCRLLGLSWVPRYLTLWMGFCPVEMLASDFHQCRKTELTAHKFSAWPDMGTGDGMRVVGPGGRAKDRAWRMLKDLHQDNVSSVFESVFHSGHFYRVIQNPGCNGDQSQEGGGCSVRSWLALHPFCSLSLLCAPAAMLVTGCEMLAEWIGVSVCRRHIYPCPSWLVLPTTVSVSDLSLGMRHLA